MSETIDRITFDVEDALFDCVPYRPWHSPLGIAPAGADPGDRRVIGRLHGEPVSVTDLPPHLVHRSDPPGYAHTHQYFERGADFVDWITNTAAGTRFVGPALTWDETARHVIAANAVRAALEWDIDGNIVLMPPPGYTSPLTVRPPTQRLRLSPTVAGEWTVHALRDGEPVPTERHHADRALQAPLSNICCDADPFSFEVEYPIPLTYPLPVT